MNIQTISLTQLIPSAANVRKTGGKTGIKELAASIAAHGLLQNLQVRPVKDGGFEVVAGGRRLAALKLLAKQKKIAPDYPVPCHALDEQDATEISLAENVMREAMHPADQFEAFKKLAEDGQGHEDIAARFGTTPKIVAQRLKLAVVSPKLIALYRKAEMTLDCLMAFTVCENHKQQEKAWASLPEYARRNPDHIRSALTEKHIAADSKLARFIGIKAYEKAGGAVLRDLFDDENAGWLTDAALVHQLAADKLEKAAAELRTEGWKWVEIIPELEWDTFNRFTEAEPDDSKALAGAVIGISYDGLHIRRGLIRPEDRAAARKARQANGGEPTEAADNGEAEKSGLAAKLVEDLTAHRTAALQAMLADNPKVALAAVVHTLALSIFHAHDTASSVVRILPTVAGLDRSAEGIATAKAVKQLEAATQAVRKRLPKKADRLWDWCLEQDQKTLLAVLAVCAAHTVDAVAKRRGATDHAPDAAHAGQLGQALKLDMAAYWQPTAASYFGRVSKGLILEAVTEGIGQQAADNIAALKKHAMADKASELLIGKNWLPALLR